MTRLLAITSALALILTASTGFAAQESTWGNVKQRTADLDLQAAAKQIRASATDVASLDGQQFYQGTGVGTFTPKRGGSLNVSFPNYSSWGDVAVRYALFEVEPGSMTTTEEITMIVTSGYRIDETMAAFGPAGLEFLPAARLTIVYWWNRPEQITDAVLAELAIEAEHIYADGTVTQVSTVSSRKSQTQIQVVIEVPGFSRYGLSGGF